MVPAAEVKLGDALKDFRLMYVANALYSQNGRTLRCMYFYQISPWRYCLPLPGFNIMENATKQFSFANLAQHKQNMVPRKTQQKTLWYSFYSVGDGVSFSLGGLSVPGPSSPAKKLRGGAGCVN
jgi:hypothetical protein